jgi:hypothetical protein
MKQGFVPAGIAHGVGQRILPERLVVELCGAGRGARPRHA